jgi:oligopeptide/dipeptide ABC transporter ATP-binding protein
MYLGRIVEEGPRDVVYGAARHPYTRALLSAVPVPDPTRTPARQQLSGEPPSPVSPPSGCAFHPRLPARGSALSRGDPAARAGHGRARGGVLGVPAQR